MKNMENYFESLKKVDTKRKTIFICSPYSGDIENNVEYAKKICYKVALQGHLPIAPHLYFTSFLNDKIGNERNLGIELGKELMLSCDEVWICSMTLTKGMEEEVKFAIEENIPIKFYQELKRKGVI